ncbi:LOW QUALITY PROTEIN: DNA damage-inducible transcript 4-like protein-like [Boleophthalmus pectinirostris]|uniref:LOW QUALITY PROTEIN: DNA damage-inducible transcript 4-like protein-like n=1 Tax=Boleophthalmus pectinirostris TaxID=150288 RepID=UPI00242FB180|nr:LOW QUALITY PROTEIN: DNA damage-inducible transcript 4-like protein-like [Boleophthalmus pectinirostris]
MVYTTALLFGHGVPVLPEENGVVDLIEKFLFPKTSTGSKMPPAHSARRGSVESYEDADNHSLSGTFDTTLEEEERHLQHSIIPQLELCLTSAKSSALQCQALMLPCHMTTKVSQDVVRASADEPCGLRGAFVKVFVETKDGPKFLGAILPDPSVTPTFELSVWFKTEERGWPPLKHIFDQSKTVKLRPEYRLVKRKLYSSASPVVHDFN